MTVDAAIVDVETEDFEAAAESGGMETVRFRIVSRTLLLMKSSDAVNPLNEDVRKKAALTAKRPKQRTDEDIWEIYRLDFVLSLYYDDDLGPFIPGVNIEAAGLVAAKQEKLGPKWTAGVHVVEDRLALEYKGPRDRAKLWEKRNEFVDIRSGKLGGRSSIMICRPKFSQWAVSGTLAYNPGIIDRQAAIRCLKKVGDVGLCDYRKRYGKGVVTIEGEE